MPKDFLYTKAPLIEVVAEIRWELRPLLAIPNAAVDPYFPVLSDQLGALLKDAGYTRLERLVPEQVPTEMFPYKPLLRYRRHSEDWPLFQIGPGLLAVNIVPPYGGWVKFRSFIKQAAEWLFKAFPVPEKYLKIETLELRYIDAFTQSFGYTNCMDFINDKLALNLQIPAQIAALSNEPKGIILQAEMRVPVDKDINGTLTIKVTPGTVNTADALLMELVCKRERAKMIDNPDVVLRWMDGAHGLLREAFKRVTSDRLKEDMGPIIEIEETVNE